MDFGNALNRLIELTGVSRKDVADRIGYHNSYISKWTAGKNIPAEKEIDVLISTLSSYFAVEIEKKKLHAQLQEFTTRSLLLIDLDTIMRAVNSILGDAYSFSLLQSKSTTKDDAFTIRTMAVTGYEKIAALTVQLIAQAIQTAQREVEIMMTFDLFWLSLPEHLNSFDMTVTREIDVKMKLAITENQFPTAPEKYFGSFFNLILRTAPFEVQLYNRKDFRGGYFLICKDMFCCYYLVDDDNRIQSMFYTEDPDIIEFSIQKASPLFQRKNLLMEEVKEDDFEYMLYKGHRSKSANCLITGYYMNGFFLDELLLDALYRRGEIGGKQFGDLVSLLQESDKILETNNVTMLIPNSMLVDFRRFGEIQVGLHRMFLNEEEIQQYFENIAIRMEQLPNFTVIVFDDSLTPFNRKNTQYSFLYFPPRAYIKKDLAVLKKDSYIYYDLSSTQMVDSLLEIVEESKNSFTMMSDRDEIISYLLELAEQGAPA